MKKTVSADCPAKNLFVSLERVARAARVRLRIATLPKGGGMAKAAAVLLAVMGCACASRRGVSGPPVAVYEANAKAPVADRPMPEGCRLLERSGPVDQMESERTMEDPYRSERRKAAKTGGNVLLVLSERLVTRPNLDCPSGDTSADCLRGAQSWYRVSFEKYACPEEALRTLAALSPPDSKGGGITIPLSGGKTAASRRLSPAELNRKVLEMMKQGVSADVILVYVEGQRLSRKLTAEEIIDWTKAGIPDAVIRAAASR